MFCKFSSGSKYNGIKSLQNVKYIFSAKLKNKIVCVPSVFPRIKKALTKES